MIESTMFATGYSQLVQTFTTGSYT
jgi:hypothetical protein